MKLSAWRWNLPFLAGTLALFVQGAAYAHYTISTLASSSPTATITANGVAVDATQRVYTTGWVPQVSPDGSPNGRSNTVILALTGTVSPVVGSNGSNNPFPGCDGPAAAVGMTDLAGVAVDDSGGIYVAQSGNGPILEVDGAATCLLDDTYFFASAITTDGAGNVYFAAPVPNKPGYAVYEITAAGTLVTFAGNGQFGCSGGDLGNPQGLAVDRAGKLYVADASCNVIWRVSSPGALPTAVAGNGVQAYSGDGGIATSASLCEPRGVAVDYHANLFIADWCNNRIREVSATSHVIATIAGNGTAGLSGDGGSALGAELQFPLGIAVGSDGRIYFGDQDGSANPVRVRQLTPPSARITSPAPGSILPSTSVTFSWAGTSAGTEFRLKITDTLGNTFFNGTTTATSQTVSDLPSDGRTLNVQLQTYVSGQWLSPARYTYRACP